MRFLPFPELKTDRLLLRKIEISDCDEILFLRTDKTVNKYIERPAHRQTKNLSEVKRYIKSLDYNLKINKAIPWGISLKEDTQLIGTIGLWNFSDNGRVAEVGYDLHPDFHGRGIMSEALQAITAYGFEFLRLVKIEAFTHKDNLNSRKLLAKNQFQLNKNRQDPEDAATVIFEFKNPGTYV